MVTFNYLNHPTVQGLLGQIHRRIYGNLQTFDTRYNTFIAPSTDPDTPSLPTVHSADLWVEFINFWMERMVNHFSQYAAYRIAQLKSGWQRRMDANPNVVRVQTAGTQALADIKALGDQIEAVVKINRDPFVTPHTKRMRHVAEASPQGFAVEGDHSV
jgi:succinate dehydrogenase/fumarate reductase flavoprotein subunit